MKLTVTCYPASWQLYCLYSTGSLPLSEDLNFQIHLLKRMCSFCSLSIFLYFTFCCTRSCFLAAYVYSIFSGIQSSVGLFFLENENTHSFEIVLNYLIQCYMGSASYWHLLSCCFLSSLRFTAACSEQSQNEPTAGAVSLKLYPVDVLTVALTKFYSLKKKDLLERQTKLAFNILNYRIHFNWFYNNASRYLCFLEYIWHQVFFSKLKEH